MGCLNFGATPKEDPSYSSPFHSFSKDDPQTSAAETAVVDLRLQPSNFIQRHVGTIWENYTQIRFLGKGANASVYEAESKHSLERRAVKVLAKRKLRLRQESIDKFLAEVNILKQLDHPNIVKLYEFYEDEANFYLVTEYLTGGELFDFIITKKQINEPMAANFMEQLLGAVNYCHANNIVHRDLKPENLLRETLHDTSAIKVIDFGESTLLPPGKRLNSLLGTAYYVAPEVLNSNYNQKCDIWSCGVILYIMLSGSPPFAGRNDHEIFDKVRQGQVSFARKAWRTISPQAKELIQQMLTVDIERRISAQEALRHPWFSKMKNPNPLDGQIMLESIDKLKSFRSASKLRQAICVFIAAQLISKEERDRLTTAFKLIDKNHDGKLSRDEMNAELRKTMPRDQADAKAREIFQNCDADGSGFIDYTEFLSAGMRLDSASNTSTLKAAFAMFDTDGSGSISLDELRNILGADFLETDEAWRNLLQEADANGDGEIDMAEFQQLVLKLN